MSTIIPLDDDWNPYHMNGYETRKEYLESLAEEYDCPIETVRELAFILGKDEDFDGLVSALEDYEAMQGGET